MAGERLISIRLAIAEAVEAEVDAFRLRQVVDNLLSNAIKYNRAGGKVTVSIAPAERAVRIVVADTGLGISPSDLAQLFDRFFRTETARKGDAVGSGLGLNITRDIVRRHGGNLVVTSELGTGSNFIMTLPTESSGDTPPSIPDSEPGRTAV